MAPYNNVDGPLTGQTPASIAQFGTFLIPQSIENRDLSDIWLIILSLYDHSIHFVFQIKKY